MLRGRLDHVTAAGLLGVRGVVQPGRDDDALFRVDLRLAECERRADPRRALFGCNRPGVRVGRQRLARALEDRREVAAVAGERRDALW